MMDFLGYTLFTGFDYLSLLFVTFALFNLDFRHFIKESLVLTLFLILATYLIIINDLVNVVPIPIVMLVSFVVMFIKALGVKRWKYSIVITVGSLLFYLIYQTGAFYIFVYMNVITPEDINNPFSINTYILQTMYSSVAIIIGVYTKLFGNGFGFMLRKGRVLGFFLTSVILFLAIFLCWLGYNISEKFSLIIMVSIVALISSAVFFILSHRRDKYEYS